MSQYILCHEVAELLRFSPATVRRLARERQIPFVQLKRRGRLLFDRRQILDLLQARHAEAQPEVAPA